MSDPILQKTNQSSVGLSTGTSYNSYMMNSKQLQGKLTLQKVKQALRQPYTWPGAYPIQMWAYDGCICHDCVRSNFRCIVTDTKSGVGGWNIVGVDVLWEGNEYCAHCGKDVETAYGRNEVFEL